MKIQWKSPILANLHTFFLKKVFTKVLHIFKKSFTITRPYIFWCAWESTIKDLPKSLLPVGILILNIVQFLQVDETYINKRNN